MQAAITECYRATWTVMGSEEARTLTVLSAWSCLSSRRYNCTVSACLQTTFLDQLRGAAASRRLQTFNGIQQPVHGSATHRQCQTDAVQPLPAARSVTSKTWHSIRKTCPHSSFAEQAAFKANSTKVKSSVARIARFSCTAQGTADKRTFRVYSPKNTLVAHLEFVPPL